MTEDVILANARLVLADETVTGALVIRNGEIAAIDQGATVSRGAVDCEGDYLAPGLIEVHTDNLERHMKPRPRVAWPLDPAILAHDAELASTGITTVFDALRVGSIPTGSRAPYGKYARDLSSKILAMREKGVFRISHFLHLRAEICSETLIEELAEFTPEDRVGIVSLMDHMPGQRQFSDISKYQEYMSGKYGLTQAEFDDHVESLYALHARLGADNEAAAVAEGKRLGAALASHDDTTVEQVEVSAGHGVRLAEFPTTVEAAAASRDAGIAVIMGAPNVVRGGSHSGNVAAMDLAKAGLLDILSSDYVPFSLLTGAVQLGQEWDDMARGLATVTDAPARATGLTDRGRLAPGLRADLVRFRLADGHPVPLATWSRGRRV
ncbi:alpha-D-ribose 1-methylphosphonate 5-triphosphate diphosphatase [Marinibacterium profundimaris]|uniref:Phosphonate metabolism protein PhnM n=1 Tax=Marinibacterium profundimaris TaxID=1679460 RepID=A0A225ND90_9RHOB|nr:alpha-D-ribose 1-methylphosphonate 5-triphosphate diphosphatase [Marinibacterium profundimaris]OWU69557.1 phosphonate metabolism protein PhnM [Marinibacterium profundimaris]